MKLLNCYISSFGKIKDLSIDFSGELNTFKEENGWGKSTVTVFIKAMFYGLDDTKRAIAENERTKFKPWDFNGSFGGRLDFEWGGKDFRIERYFGAKSSEDSVKLFDLATGKEYSKTEDLGKRIFEIDEEGFFSTTYFSQKDFSAKSNSSITAKFNALAQPEDENAFEIARKKLEDKAKSYKYRGDKGIISDLKREKIDVDTKLRQAGMAEQTALLLKTEIKQKEAEAVALKSEIEKLNDSVANAGKAETITIKKQLYENAVNDKQSLEKKLAECDQVLNGNRPIEQELNALSNCLYEYSDTLRREQAIEEGVRTLTEAEKVTPPSTKNNSKLTLVALVLALLLVGLGIGLIFLNLIVGIAVTAVGVVATILMLITRFTARKTGETTDYSLLIVSKQAELDGYREIRQNYEKTIRDFLSKYSVLDSDFTTALSQVRDNVLTVNKIEIELKDIVEKISEYEKDADLNVVPQVTSGTAELKRAIMQSQYRYNDLVNEIAKKRASVEYYENLSASIPDLEGKLAELSEKIKNAEEDYKILNYTLEYLDKADENLKIKYRSPLEDGFNKYLSKIAGGKLGTARIDVDLKVTITENSGSKDTDFYSKGYRNLFEICKRFALIDVLFTKEKPFIILDDPFSNFDKQKIEKALDLICKLSKEYQIIYLTCHESRSVK